jgi:hypothetical protein
MHQVFLNHKIMSPFIFKMFERLHWFD